MTCARFTVLVCQINGIGKTSGRSCFVWNSSTPLHTSQRDLSGWVKGVILCIPKVILNQAPRWPSAHLVVLVSVRCDDCEVSHLFGEAINSACLKLQASCSGDSESWETLSVHFHCRICIACFEVSTQSSHRFILGCSVLKVPKIGRGLCLSVWAKKVDYDTGDLTFPSAGCRWLLSLHQRYM